MKQHIPPDESPQSSQTANILVHSFVFLMCLNMINRQVVTSYPVFTLLFKPLLKLVDLFLQYMNPLCELGGCQLLFLVVTGAER